jgi:hypothetical protein
MEEGEFSEARECTEKLKAEYESIRKGSRQLGSRQPV